MLVRGYNKPSHYRKRFDFWFTAFTLKGRLLEIGFNSGKSAYWLYQRYKNLEIFAFDFSTALLPVAKILSSRIHCFLADGVAIPLRNRSIDHVTILDVVEHLPPQIWKRALKEIRRVTTGKGLVFIHVGTSEAKEHINNIE